MNPITMRHIENGELMPDPIYVLWTGSQGDTGEYVSLLTGIPYEAYVLVKHDQPFNEGMEFHDGPDERISLNRPDAGQLAVALIKALIDGSEKLLDYYVQQQMARR